MLPLFNFQCFCLHHSCHPHIMSLVAHVLFLQKNVKALQFRKSPILIKIEHLKWSLSVGLRHLYIKFSSLCMCHIIGDKGEALCAFFNKSRPICSLCTILVVPYYLDLYTSELLLLVSLEVVRGLQSLYCCKHQFLQILGYLNETPGIYQMSFNVISYKKCNIYCNNAP